MAINGFDTPDQLTQSAAETAKSEGFTRVGRYVSGGGGWKHLTEAEVAVCKAVGLDLFLIDEATGDAAQFASGRDGGLAAGQRAAVALRALNVPEGTPIFVGVDFDAGQGDVENITNYMAGYKEGVAPYKAGMYADGLIASQVPSEVGDFVPGAGGWEGTKEYLQSGKVAIIQHPPTNMFGLDADPCEILDESVLWKLSGESLAKAPNPAPSSDSNPWPDLKIGQAYLQEKGLYTGQVDGVVGPLTLGAIEKLYGG